MDTSEAAQAVEFALDQFPYLNCDGFKFRCDKKLHEVKREKLRGDLAGAATALAFLDNKCERCPKGGRWERDGNSSEYLARHAQVSNGALIAAALFRGAMIEDINGPNAVLSIRLRSVKHPDEALAQRIAEQLADRGRGQLRFSVHVGQHATPPFPFMWEWKQVRGSTFANRVAATAWIKTALLEGYRVFHDPRKKGWGASRSLKDGLFEDGE